MNPTPQGGGTEPFWPDPDRYARAVHLFAKAGFQCVTHATGDRAVRAALDAYRAAGAVPGVRHRVEHIETLQDHDLPRFAAEGVAASMQPLHMQWRRADHTDSWAGRLGRERTSRAWRTRDLLDSGALAARSALTGPSPSTTRASEWPGRVCAAHPGSRTPRCSSPTRASPV